MRTYKRLLIHLGIEHCQGQNTSLAVKGAKLHVDDHFLSFV